MARIAISPALFLLIVEGAVWALSAATEWGGWIVVGMLGLAAGILAGILAVPLIALRDEEGAVAWSVVSVCLSILGVLFGFIFWLEAMTVACSGHCFD